MKKRFPLFLLAAVLLAVSVWAVAAGGIDDPLASLSYLQGTFTQTVDEKVDQRLDASDRELLNQIDASGSPVSAASTWVETRLKSDDIVSGSTGANILPLAGTVKVAYSGSAVVDVTAGSVVASGSTLVPQHRYMVAEDTDAQFITTSKTSVLDYQGPCSFSYSYATDYNAMASALKSLNLFKGSTTGYGSGFDLEAAPTRLQAIIMFIRLLGEEDAALASSGQTPFTDVANGSLGSYYIGYAYEKGYTNGYTATLFKPGNKVNANQYTEFILRAMGYSSSANTHIADALDRAINAGVITPGEAAMLQQDPFLRAELVYLSYYSLDAYLPDGSQTLADALMDRGVFTAKAYSKAQNLVPGYRL